MKRKTEVNKEREIKKEGGKDSKAERVERKERKRNRKTWERQ